MKNIKDGPFNLFNKEMSLRTEKFARSPMAKNVFRQCAPNVRPFLTHLTLVKHALWGQQMWVSKEVSDDLMASQIDEVDFESLAWPADHLEIFFEDPCIPSVLAQRYNWLKIQERLHQEIGLSKAIWDLTKLRKSDPGSDVFCIQMDQADGNVISTVGSGARIDDFATKGEAYAVTDCDAGDDAVPQNMLMCNLVYKVLLFAGSEGNAPVVNKVKATKATGGKVGFKGRPKTRRLIVKYLPHHHQERKRQASEEGKHQFKGRRGHFRIYRAERYKEMRNKRVFIYPVPGPDGTVPNTRTQFRVVKR